MQTTIVKRLDQAAGRRLYDELGQGNYAFRSLAHAKWSARGEGITATLYTSGKLVVQGQGAETFVSRYLPDTPTEEKAPAQERVEPGGPELGSDESGKGDYFGPLVVAAARVCPEDGALLEELGVEDSKAATDTRIRRVEGMLMDRLPHAVRVLEPSDYNAAWGMERNLNRLLGQLHAEVIQTVLVATDDAAARIVVDRFGDPEHVRRNLGDAARAHPFAMPTHGERHPAVAAASFLARAAFLRGVEELEGLAGGPLPRGASDPRIMDVARGLVREGGREWLGKFAKLHFKTTQKL